MQLQIRTGRSARSTHTVIKNFVFYNGYLLIYSFLAKNTIFNADIAEFIPLHDCFNYSISVGYWQQIERSKEKLQF